MYLAHASMRQKVGFPCFRESTRSQNLSTPNTDTSRVLAQMELLRHPHEKALVCRQLCTPHWRYHWQLRAPHGKGVRHGLEAQGGIRCRGFRGFRLLRLRRRRKGLQNHPRRLWGEGRAAGLPRQLLLQLVIIEHGARAKTAASCPTVPPFRLQMRLHWIPHQQAAKFHPETITLTSSHIRSKLEFRRKDNKWPPAPIARS